MMIMLLYCRSDFLTKTIISFPLNKLLVVRVMFKNNKAGQRNRNSFSHYVRYISRKGNIWTALCCWGRLRKRASTADLYSGIRIAYNIGFTESLHTIKTTMQYLNYEPLKRTRWPPYFVFTDIKGTVPYNVWQAQQKRYNSHNQQRHGQFSFSTGCTMALRLHSTTDFNNNGRVRNTNN